jgi:hypothetical protein
MYIPLEQRQVLRVSGEDRHNFLQGLLTNDIELLKQQKSLYACLLTPQGKFLHEFFIFEDKNSICLDTEKSRAQEALEALSKYKLRAKVNIEIDEDLRVFACFEPADVTLNAKAVPDTRRKKAGERVYTNGDMPPHTDFRLYERTRISLGLPDGSRDIEPERMTMAEARLDELNGVSFSKGCYVGQEVTARVHNRGLVKKRLRAVRLLSGEFPAYGEDFILDGEKIGQMKSSIDNLALILLRLDKENIVEQSESLKFV